MKPLDTFNKDFLSLSNASKFLSDTEYQNFLSLSDEVREAKLFNLFTKPIADFSVINELYFRSKWAELIQLNNKEKPIILLEIASGDADMIPQSLSCSNPKSTYISANMNKALNQSLLEKTTALNLTFQLIDDDAGKITNYIKEETVDVIAFQHGVNDVLQAILCDGYGIDTIYSDWMEILPEMINILQKEIKENTFESKVKEPFLELIDTLSAVLKKDGIIAINHYMFQLDLDMEYPKDLFENMILLIRNWLKENTRLTEVFYEGFEKQWWLFLKKR